MKAQCRNELENQSNIAGLKLRSPYLEQDGRTEGEAVHITVMLRERINSGSSSPSVQGFLNIYSSLSIPIL